MTRAQLVEQVAKIIAGPDIHGNPDEETWRLWRTVAEQICALLLDTGRQDASEGKKPVTEC
jgi:hypothetical protein